MAPAPSRVAPAEYDRFIVSTQNATPPPMQDPSPGWIKRLPLRVQRAWGISCSSLPPMPPPPRYVYYRRARLLAFRPRPSNPPPQPRLQRSPWQEDLPSIANTHRPAYHQASPSGHQPSAYPQAPLHDQAGLHGRDDHSPNFSLNQAHQDEHAEPKPFHLRSGSQDFFPPPPPHSPPYPDSPPPYSYLAAYPEWTACSGEPIYSDLVIDFLEHLVNVLQPVLSLESRESLRSDADDFLDGVLLQGLEIHFDDDSAEEDWSQSDWTSESEVSLSSSLFVEHPTDSPVNPSFTPEHSSSSSLSTLFTDEVEFVDQSVTLVADPATTQEHSSSPSSPVEPKRRVRQRVRSNKNKGRKVRARKLARQMAERTATTNTPVPAEGATGIKTPSIAGTTIMASDADTVRSPSPSPVPLPDSQGMHPLPAAPATVPEVAPSKKKKKKGKKKKGNRQAPQAGGDNAGASVDALSTDLPAPTLESGDFIEGVPSEAEIPAGGNTGQDGSPCASEGPSLTVVDGVEASTKPTPPKEAYVGPCIVDTESWRQRMLARLQEAKAKREAGFLASTPRAGGVFSYSGNQSENGWAQMPMGGHSAATQFSQGGGHQVGYAMTRPGALARADCTWKPRCCHHYQGSQSRSCCCLHGAEDCWQESDMAQNADYLPPAPLPVDTQEPALSQVSSPKSSSLGGPVSEPIVESVVSVFAEANTVKSLDLALPVQPTTTPEVAPVMSTSRPANIMATLQAHLGENLTAEDLKSPSLYFDAKSKNLGSSPLASEKSNDASTSVSPMPEGEAPRASSAVDRPETRNQGCQAVAADQTEATGPLAFQSEHIRALFGNPEFADIQLLLSPGMSHPPIVYYLHKPIIASSPFLHNVMAAKLYREGWVNHVRVFTGVSFTCSHGVTMALQVLYGAPLVTNDNLRKVTLEGLNVSDDGEDSSFSFSVDRAMVDFALCYAATGALLARREITERGIDMAISNLSWDTAEFLLNFGMTPLTYMVTCPDVPFSPISPPTSRASSLSGGNGNGTPVVGLDHFHDFHYVQANRALNAALRFITNAVTPDFELYRRAQARYTPSRIPPALHTLPGSYLSNPRLEEIRFGSLPSFADLRPTDPAILVPSAMLITLPYRIFTIAIDLIKARDNFNPELINEVVDERESRRLNALRISLRVDPRRVAPDAFAELQYQERVKVEEPGEPADNNNNNSNHLRALRTTVDRVWVGADVPNAAHLRPRRVVTTPTTGPGRTFSPGTISARNA